MKRRKWKSWRRENETLGEEEEAMYQNDEISDWKYLFIIENTAMKRNREMTVWLYRKRKCQKISETVICREKKISLNSEEKKTRAAENMSVAEKHGCEERKKINKYKPGCMKPGSMSIWPSDSEDDEKSETDSEKWCLWRGGKKNIWRAISCVSELRELTAYNARKLLLKRKAKAKAESCRKQKENKEEEKNDMAEMYMKASFIRK